jgi:hypothetical protein
VVAIATSSASIASVPANATIPAHATSGSFTITGVSLGSATISATFGTSLSALVTVRSPKVKEIKEIVTDVKVAKEKDVLKAVEQVTKVTEIKSAPAKTAEAGKIADAATSIGIGALGGAFTQTAAPARSFIRPEERPAVEESMLNPERVE